ncbi:MAG: hypothetical protein ACXWLM_01520, partial [Myxococcales bacterium]
MKQLVTSFGAQARLTAAVDWLAARGPAQRVLVVGATQEAASGLLREAALRVPAAFGWQRFTLGRLAAVVASDALAARGLSPLSPLGIEALCARVVHQLGNAGARGNFQPVARQPGLARALAQSLQEVRLAGARPGGDLGRLLAAYEAELSRAKLADRAEVLRLALEAPEHPLLALPAVLVDLPLQASVEERFLSRLRGEVLATAPAGDARAVERLARALSAGPQAAPEPQDSSLSRVQQRLFVEGTEALPPAGEDVQILSAPGESRECVEIARLVLREAARGT